MMGKNIIRKEHYDKRILKRCQATDAIVLT